MRVFNFSAGPAALPEPVLERIRLDLPSWAGTGMSVMEVSHRGRPFVELTERCEARLRSLLNVPPSYRVLFAQGGATSQFAAVPLNLAAPDRVADYVVTGSWGVKAVKQCAAFVDAHVAADSSASGHTRIPEVETWSRSAGAAYLHYTPNETIGGVEFPFIPQCDDVPLVADFSSSILSMPLDVSRFGVIYAGAQKNIGPAGITLVLVREDLLGASQAITPATLDYATLDRSGSMTNTPPTFAWYVADLVFEWLEEEGGLAEMGERNRAKSAALYAAIDQSTLYSNPVHPPHRSRMNVPFLLEDDALDEAFLTGAEAAGLTHLKGHRSVGGMRASLYNAMPMAGVEALIDYMREFERGA